MKNCLRPHTPFECLCRLNPINTKSSYFSIQQQCRRFTKANTEVQQKKNTEGPQRHCLVVLSYFLLPIFIDQLKFCMLIMNSLKRTSTIDLVILTRWWFIFIDTWYLLQMVLITSSERKCHSNQFRQDSSLGACEGIIYTLILVTLNPSL